MLRFVSAILTALLTALIISSCDRSNPAADSILQSVDCTLAGACGGNTQIGMVGDSWTDFVLGTPALMDMRDDLESTYGFKITSSNLAGLTLRTEWEQRHGFELVIKKAGPNLRYMLLSLGGNDVISSPADYNLAAQFTLDSRLASYDTRLRLLITTGDLLKQSLYGGDPLIWIIHGYDYPNPVADPSCIASYTGISPAPSDLPRFIVDGFNGRLQYLTTQIPNLRYIDARGTLGGPPISNASLMFDCIHPNNKGFAQYTAAYVLRLDAITGGAR